MQSVTADFQTAMAADVRHPVCKVEITFAGDVAGAGPTATGDSIDSDHVPASQAANGTVEAPRKWAHAADHVFPDGSWYPMDQGDEGGWWGDTVADANGDIAGGESLTLTYSSTQPCKTIRFWADEDLGYPVDFEVFYWDDPDWISITSVSGNSSTAWSYTLPAQVSSTKYKITITKVSRGNQVAKLMEFSPSYTANVTARVKDLEILKERYYESETLPVGNASANQLILTLDNTDDVFDHRNTASPYYGQLKAGRKIQVWLGFVLADDSEELVLQGTYYTVAWKATGELCTVTAYDRAKLLQDSEFSTSLVYEDYTISELVEVLLDDFGIASGDQDVDATTETIDYAWFTKASYWYHLALLAAGEGGQIYFDESDHCVFENRSHLSGGSSVLTLHDDTYLISLDDEWAQRNMRNRIRVRVRPLEEQAQTTIWTLMETLSVAAGSTKSITVWYDTYPAVDVQTPSLDDADANISVQSWIPYAWGGALTLANAGGTSEDVRAMTIAGKPLEEKGGMVAVAEDSDLIDENGVRSYSVDSQYITGLDHADALAADLLTAYEDPLAPVIVSGRGLPHLQLGDKVTVVHREKYIAADYWVTRIRLMFTGSLVMDLDLLAA